MTTERLRPSTAKMLLDMTPEAVRYALDHPSPPSRAMEFGTAVDRETFALTWTPSATAREADVIRAAITARKLIDRVGEKTGALRYMAQHTREWDSDGVACRGTPDLVYTASDGSLVIADLKTCASARADNIEQTLYRHKYDLQLAAYCTAFRANTDRAYIIWVESREPFLGRISTVPADVLHGGRQKWHRAREIWRKCVTEEYWPGYEDFSHT